jgi:hypothetical protein
VRQRVAKRGRVAAGGDGTRRTWTARRPLRSRVEPGHRLRALGLMRHHIAGDLEHDRQRGEPGACCNGGTGDTQGRSDDQRAISKAEHRNGCSTNSGRLVDRISLTQR